MGSIVQLLSIKPRSASRHQGLRKLSPDLISKARDGASTQVNRIGLAFLGTAAFCLLRLLSPDSAGAFKKGAPCGRSGAFRWYERLNRGEGLRHCFAITFRALD